MSNQTTIGELSINLKMRLEGLEKGIETAKKKLQEIEKQNEQLKNSNSGLDASFLAMSATAVVALTKIKGAIDECVSTYNDYASANIGLKSILDGQGKDFQEAQEFIQEYIRDGLIPLNNAVTAYKNLALRGYDNEQIKQTMINLKNAAAFGRQSTLEYGYAVQSATEGLKNFNPVLVDNAGVTKNMSVMYDEYAAKIGTTAAKLTDQQKILAEVNGIAEETKYQMGDSAKYAETYSGQQAKLNAAQLELSKTMGESVIPLLSQYNSLQLSIVQGLTQFISNHQGATAGIMSFVIALGTSTLAIKVLGKAYDKYTASAFKATLQTQGLTAALKANPIGLAITGISLLAGIAGAARQSGKTLEQTIEDMNTAQEKLNETTEIYNQIVEQKMGFTDEEISKVQEAKQNIEEYINEIKAAIAAKQALAQAFHKRGSEEEIENLKNTQDELNEKLKEYDKYLENANTVKKVNKALDISEVKNKQQEASALKKNVEQMQNYIKTIKNADKSSEDYQNALQAVTKAYPEAVKNGALLVDEAQRLIDADSLKADEAWKSAQDQINAQIEVLNAAMNSEAVQSEVAKSIGDSWENIAPRLQSVLSLLQTMAGYKPTEVPNITPTTTVRRSSGSSSYSNKALDNYKKEIAHKKAMDQISLQQEISMYETALRKYAKTTDEKRELREKIYELNKELAQKEKEILDKQTEDYESYIQEQKNLRGSAYDVTQQTQDYNKIIQMHKNYLNQIMKDERLSLDERKEIYREELQTIRDYEQQKRDLRVEHIDNTVSQLTNAITKQLEEMQEKDKELIDKNIEAVEKWKEARINAINEEYDARIEAIERELQALDKAEKQKSRDEEDAEYERKKKRLEDLVAYEHDAVTKANYQKELDKLIAEYQKTLDQRALEDKKEALNAQKELLKEEQNNKTQAIEDEADKQKEVYDKQLNDLEKYYEEQMNKAQETAENMLLNMEQNQDKILSLLKSYGNAYEITGQTLGEKLAQGINEGIASKIENIIARIQNSIDAGIEAQIAKMASSVYRYEAGANKPSGITNNIVQNNYIEQNPEMPSETFRKLNNISENLAAQIRTEM